MTTRSNHRQAFTLIEATISIILVGLVLVGALNTVGASQTAQKNGGDRLLAVTLADDLMREVLNPPPAATVAAGGTRQSFTGYADYSGWTSTPPVDRDGIEVPGANGMNRTVAIALTSSTALDTPTTDGNIIRVIVTVSRGGRELATLRCYVARETLASARQLPEYLR